MDMIKFFLHRPIAVTMAFVAVMMLGVATFGRLPVSLLPPVPIPEVYVQTSAPNLSAQQMDNEIAGPLRRQLMQVGGLKEIKSESRDGMNNIKLKFDFGTDINLALIEANEKIDVVAGQLPQGVARPKAIKASATDIPVFYVNMTMRDTSESRYMEMCDIARNVVQRRIEQLPEVAMTDVTGISQKTILLRPYRSKMSLAGVTDDDLRRALADNNIKPGAMVVRDGNYEYDIHVGNVVRTANDVRDVYLSKNGRVFQVKDLCDVDIVASKSTGLAMLDGRRAVSLAVIKRASADMDDLKAEIGRTLNDFSRSYPEVEFSVNRNQTELLDNTISSLGQNFVLAFILMFVAALVFMGDVRTPLVVGICLVEAVILTFLSFFVFNISLNVISLSGLVLVIGMMVDNALIVTENISQHRERGETLVVSCAKGTSEMITPMLSSSLTTVVVFVPLVFISDVTGALFSDEAYSISLGLLASYVVAVMLLPVVYLLVARLRFLDRKWNGRVSVRVDGWMRKSYDSCIGGVFRHKKLWLSATAATLPLCLVLFSGIPKALFPNLEQNDTTAKIDWNENIGLDENVRRSLAAVRSVGKEVRESVEEVGTQGYMLGGHSSMSPNETFLYIATDDRVQMQDARKRLRKCLAENWPEAQVTFASPDNIFDKVFSLSEPDIVAEIRTENSDRYITVDDVKRFGMVVSDATGMTPSTITGQDKVVVLADVKKAMVYGLDLADISDCFSRTFRDNEATSLNSNHENMPVLIAGEGGTVNEFLAKAMIQTNGADGNGVALPVSEFVNVCHDDGLKTVTAGKNGTYIPYGFDKVGDGASVVEKLTDEFQGTRHKGWDIDFSGNYFTSLKTIREMTVVFIVSLLLMYFILCAQFESFTQPLIVLAEIPIDTALALATLWVCGCSLNVMSAIGIIASCGIVVNDSILKIDTINHLRAKGMAVEAAIHEAGHRRLRSIVMTSLTTIAGMLPFFVSSDLGSELQRSLAFAMTAAIFFGTLVSLFVIPLVYCTFIKDK